MRCINYLKYTVFPPGGEHAYREGILVYAMELQDLFPQTWPRERFDGQVLRDRRYTSMSPFGYPVWNEDGEGERWDYIYLFANPCGHVRYVGHSVDPIERYKAHLYNPQNRTIRPMVNKYEKEDIGFMIIDRRKEDESIFNGRICDLEVFWMQAACELGFHLLNKKDVPDRRRRSRWQPFQVEEKHRQFMKDRVGNYFSLV